MSDILSAAPNKSYFDTEKSGVLAVTACLKRCSVALKFTDCVWEITEEADAAENLVWVAAELLKSNGIDVRDIGKVITASGPGSFTGIRVAQSFAKATALALKIPAASITYFDVIDFLYENKGSKREIDKLVVIKSEKGHAYFRKTSTDNAENADFSKKSSRTEQGISSLEDLRRMITANGERKIAVIGDVAEELASLVDSDCIEGCKNITDFKNAVYLLNFADRVNGNSRIEPLYINAGVNQPPLKCGK
jgi:tRNA threonylcarbamoyl adenosine modification protein YeaZ